MLLAHDRQDFFGQPGQTEDVDFKLTLRFFQGDVFDGTIGTVAGLIDEDVDALLFSQNPIHDLAARCGVGHIKGYRNNAIRIF